MLTTRLLATTGLVVACLWTGIAARAADWPQHLGPQRNGSSPEKAPTAWDESGPAVLWRKAVGAGFSAPVVARGKVFLFHRVGGSERLESLDPEDGTTLWTHDSATTYRDDFGFDEGPRSAPTVSGDTVFTHGAQGLLTAIDLTSGVGRWSLPTMSVLGVRKGFFGVSASPLVVDGRVLLNVGGKDSGIVAFDVDDGSVLWKSTTDEASYSSAVSADLGSGPTAVFFTRSGLVVLDPATGAVQSRFRWRSRSGSSVNAATPLIDGTRIFVSSSYQTGAALLDLESGGIEPVWTSDEALSSHYATSVLHEGYLYGFHGRQEYGPSLRCVEWSTGAVLWSEERFGSGSLVLVADRLLILHEDGRLLLANATPEGLEILAESEILQGVVRAYPAYSDGVLFARNQRELVAVRLRDQLD